MQKHYTHFSENERRTLYKMRRRNYSLREIARCLERDVSTLRRELHRNGGVRGYRPRQAQRMSEARQQSRPRHRVLIEELKKVARVYLQMHWSPEQIAGRLRLRYDIRVSHVTLYRWIRRDQKQGGRLHLLLRNQGRCYAHGYGRKAYTRCIPGRSGIEERPAVVASRERVGDWEADTMHGSRHKGYPVTLIERKRVERKTRLTVAAPVAQKEKAGVEQTILQLLQPLSHSAHHHL